MPLTFKKNSESATGTVLAVKPTVTAISITVKDTVLKKNKKFKKAVK